MLSGHVATCLHELKYITARGNNVSRKYSYGAVEDEKSCSLNRWISPLKYILVQHLRFTDYNVETECTKGSFAYNQMI